MTTCSTGQEVNTPPVCAIDTVVLGSVVVFEGRVSSDPDGSVVAYLWDFGDGATSTAPDVIQTYDSAGSYEVTLAVTDDDGATSNGSTTVVVQ